MKKILLPILLIFLLFIPTSCDSEPTAEQVKLGYDLVNAYKELSDVAKIGMELKKKHEKGEISNIDFIKEIAKNEKDVKEASEAVGIVKDSIEAANKAAPEGSNWWDIGKGAVISILGRTALHAGQAALAGSTGGASTFISALLAMCLGGSASGAKKEQ